MAFSAPPRPTPPAVHRRLRGWVCGAHHDDAGATIMEIVIAATLLAITFSAAAVLTGVSSRSLTSSASAGSQQSLIDADLAAVRDLAETYTWCSGAGAFTSCTTGVAARTENYYFPPPANTAAITSFETACSNTVSDSLNTALVTAINGRAALPGISRTVANDDIATHRLSVTYAGNGVNRVVLLVPTVAAWCP